MSKRDKTTWVDKFREEQNKKADDITKGLYAKVAELDGDQLRKMVHLLLDEYNHGSTDNFCGEARDMFHADIENCIDQVAKKEHI